MSDARLVSESDALVALQADNRAEPTSGSQSDARRAGPRRPAKAALRSRRRVRRGTQMPITFSTYGGFRPGAGRKRGRRVSHTRRPEHKRYHPVHVTLRAVSNLRSLRNPVLFARLRDALVRASRRGFAILQFSVQSNHIHLLVEAHDRCALSRAMQGLAVRLARTCNRAVRRRGSVFADRYHAHALTTPREVRNAIVYILQNHIKHVPGARGMDEMSSAVWFSGWADASRRAHEAWARRRFPTVVAWRGSTRGQAPDLQVPPCPVDAPLTWLARTGWLARAGGPISADERPAVRTAPQ
jgi:putative transposase